LQATQIHLEQMYTIGSDNASTEVGLLIAGQVLSILVVNQLSASRAEEVDRVVNESREVVTEVRAATEELLARFRQDSEVRDRWLRG
jgi:hypothetical protein